MTQNLPMHLKDILKRLATDLGMERFILCGGAAFDLLQSPDEQPRDIDLVIGSGKRYIRRCIEHLEQAGYEIIENNREYYINITIPVTMVFVRNANWLLDIAFMEEPTSVGQFDIETLYWRYPELDIVDRYRAFHALEEQTIRPIHDFDTENPYLLINRFIYLCAKYNLKMCDNAVHRNLIEHLKKSLMNWQPPNHFHGPVCQTAHYSTVLKSLLRAHHRFEYAKDLEMTGIIKITMPEVQTALERLISAKDSSFTVVQNKSEVARLMLKLVNDSERTDLKKRFLALGIRRWDQEDQRTAKIE